MIQVDGLTFAGRHWSQVCTGTPFFARLTRPVMGVSLTGTSVLAEELLKGLIMGLGVLY